MATPFDAIKAQTEVLTGLRDVHKVIGTRARQAERVLVEAEAEFNSLTKLDRFVEGLIEAGEDKLRALKGES